MPTSMTKKMLLCLTFACLAEILAHSQEQRRDAKATTDLSLSVEIHRVYSGGPAGQERVHEEFVASLANSGKERYFVSEQATTQWEIRLYRQGHEADSLPIAWQEPPSPISEIESGQSVRAIATWEITAATVPGTYEVEVRFIPSGDREKGRFDVGPPIDKDILFTSKLMGYYRLPDRQGFVPPSLETPCPLPGKNYELASRDAAVFMKRVENRDRGTVLVGTGDNFAPNYYARAFAGPADKDHPVLGKELYDWDSDAKGWAWYDHPSPGTSASLEEGTGTIPTDNVGCFLSYVKYDALVPGKHDFYYGPERLRELARFLASVTDTGHFQPVQILAANMFIKTTWAKDHVPIPDTGKRPLPFVTRFLPVPKPLPGPKALSRPKADAEPSPYRSLEIGDFTDSGFAFPWMQFVRVTATGWNRDLVKTRLQVFLCEAEAQDPDHFLNIGGFCRNQRLLSLDQDATSAAEQDSDPGDGAKADGTEPLVYRVPSPNALLPGKNYAICIPPPEVTLEHRKDRDAVEAKPYCFRFSVYNPYFQFPNWADPEHGDPAGKYKNPKLYVLKETGATPVVIFGVVDPQLAEQVGGDNLSWKTVRGSPGGRVHTERKYNTEVTLGDPVQALVQLEDYFEKEYADQHSHQEFHGIRVLLAQMPPTEAKQLAEHFPKCLRFDAIISAADDGLATPNQVLQLHPGSVDESRACHANVGASGLKMASKELSNGALISPATFSAVPPTHEQKPAPYSAKQTDKPTSKDQLARFLQLRTLHVADSYAHREYTLSGDPIPILVPDTRKLTKEINDFWESVCETLYENYGQEGQTNCSASPATETQPQPQLVMKTTPKAGLPSQLPWDDKVKKVAIQQLALWSMREQYHADVALLQERDFYLSGLEDYLAEHCEKLQNEPLQCPENSLSKWDVQEVLNRIIWKGDYVQVRSVQGSVLKSILKQSDQFAKTEKSAYFSVSETGRPLVHLGLRKDLANGGDFLINGKPLDPNALYTVVTSDHIALGDTGYTDLATPPVGDPPQPTSSAEQIVTISSRTCDVLSESQKVIPINAYECSGALTRQNYYDRVANRKPDDPRKGNTNWYKFYAWTFFHGDLGQPIPKKLQNAPPGPDDISAETQKRIELLPTWDVSLDKFSVGFSALGHTDSEQALSQQFGGVQNGQVNAKHFHSWDWDANSKATWFHPRADLFLSEGLQYSSNFTSQISGPRSETQSRNQFSIDSGAYFHPWNNRKDLPQLSAVASEHFETQVGNPITNINLSPVPPSTSSSTLSFHQGRTNLLLGRAGVRFQDRKSYAEAGLEGGETLNAIQGFNVIPSPGVSTVSCLLEASVSLTKCLSTYNKNNPLSPVTPTSSVSVVRRGQARYGAYWNMGINVPIKPTISYNFQETSDYFFLSAGDNSADTRFRHQLVNSLKFTVFPNLSFEPTYTIFFYENKVDYHFLLQQQYTVKINYSFDWSNWHESKQELRFKKTASQ